MPSVAHDRGDLIGNAPAPFVKSKLVHLVSPHLVSFCFRFALFPEGYHQGDSSEQVPFVLSERWRFWRWCRWWRRRGGQEVQDWPQRCVLHVFPRRDKPDTRGAVTHPEHFPPDVRGGQTTSPITNSLSQRSRQCGSSCPRGGHEVPKFVDNVISQGLVDDLGCCVRKGVWEIRLSPILS